LFPRASHARLSLIRIEEAEFVRGPAIERDPEADGGPDADRLGALPSAMGSITRLAYQRAKDAGIVLDLILKKARLTLAEVQDPALRLHVRGQITFVNLVAEALKDGLLGFHLALLPDLRSLGLVYYVAASSGNLSEALKRTARYSTIVNEGVALKYFDGGDIGIAFDHVGISRHLDRQQIVFFVTLLLRVCRQLTGQRLSLARVRFAHRGAMSPELLEFFGTDIKFDADVDDIALVTGAGQLPIITADPYLNTMLVKYCDQAIAARSALHATFRTSVENAIAPVLPHSKVRLDEIARKLGVSQRTLARRLALEGVTFSEVLERLRADLAARYLKERDLSISQIAWLLGYQEVSAFTHAFKRWTGRTPRAARVTAP
jgi:AraC-like DNA-binding protein